MQKLPSSGRYSPMSAEQYKVTEMSDDFTLIVIVLAVICLNTVTAKLTLRSAERVFLYFVSTMDRISFDYSTKNIPTPPRS